MDEAEKKKLLSTIKRLKKKRRVKKVVEPKLVVGGVSSPLFAEEKISKKYRTREETEDLRKALQNLSKDLKN